MMHKTKFFKKVFQATADDVIRYKNNKPVQSMTEEMFVPLMGEMWEKAKKRYRTRYKARSFAFAEWCNFNYDYYVIEEYWRLSGTMHLTKKYTTEELSEIWKAEIKNKAK